MAAVVFAAASVVLALALSECAASSPQSAGADARALWNRTLVGQGDDRSGGRIRQPNAARDDDRSPALTAPVHPATRYGVLVRTTYRVHALLKEAKIEADQDIHLVLADPTTGETMIAEFPASSCTAGTASAARTRMAAARAAFITACGTPSSTRFHQLSGAATVSGVGFFDRIHGQTGVAPNGIELHPVLRFTRATC